MDNKTQNGRICAGKCRLKWFNESKGFGFLVPEEALDESVIDRDAFIHVSVFQKNGIKILGQDALLKCELSSSEKGLLVEEILEVLDEGDFEAHKVKIPLPPEAGHAYDLKGKVKWYRADKGYGFVAGEDGKKDIFVHQTALRRNGISDDDFCKGAEVEMSVRDVDQGREAVEIRLDSGNVKKISKHKHVQEVEEYREEAAEAVGSEREDKMPDHAVAAMADQ